MNSNEAIKAAKFVDRALIVIFAIVFAPCVLAMARAGRAGWAWLFIFIVLACACYRTRAGRNGMPYR